MKKLLTTRNRWQLPTLLTLASMWRSYMRERIGVGYEGGTWWSFISRWSSNRVNWLRTFTAGLHQFSPLRQYCFPEEVLQVWCYLDRLMIHLILTVIKPTFKHIISPFCMHLAGPSAVKKITDSLRLALNKHDVQFVIRADIRGYYAHIQHDILLKQLFAHYDDPMLRRYLEAIVTIPIDKDGVVFRPTQGIPRGSALSPFFGARYLSKLDHAFANRKGVFYRRYQDDIIILFDHKRQYQRAKKRLYKILRKLRLQLSPHKTRMGRLEPGFHFLGVEVEVPRSPQHKTQVSMTVHTRTCQRDLDRVEAMKADAVDPAIIQRYLIRWATWWHSVVGLGKDALIQQWSLYAEDVQPSAAWIGRGLLLGRPSTR